MEPVKSVCWFKRFLELICTEQEPLSITGLTKVTTEGMSFMERSGVIMLAVKFDPEKAAIFVPIVPVRRLDVTVYPKESRLAGSVSMLPYASSCSNVRPDEEDVVIAVEDAIESNVTSA